MAYTYSTTLTFPAGDGALGSGQYRHDPALRPAYLRERRRLLSNAACMLRCARQYGPHEPDGGLGYRLGRKADQRQLAKLRSAWSAKAVQS